MAYQGIGTGTTPNDNTGDSLLTGAVKVNSNFQEIYSTFGDGTNLDVNIVAFPSGTAMLFQQTAAPTGWTKQTTHNNKSLRVVSGTAGSGGSTAFTSVFTSRSVSLSGTVGSTTLTVAQIPSHSHSIPTSTANFGLGGCEESVFTGSNFNTGANGGGGSHTHSFTGSSTSLDFDVQYVDVIIATKD